MVHTQCEQTAECSIDVSNDEVHRLCGMKSGKRNSIFPFKHTHTHKHTEGIKRKETRFRSEIRTRTIDLNQLFLL